MYGSSELRRVVDIAMRAWPEWRSRRVDGWG